MGKSAQEGEENCKIEYVNVNHCEVDSVEDKLETAGDCGKGYLQRRSVTRRIDPPSTPTAELPEVDTRTPNMDNLSVGSFDHFDFDASLCSLKSTDMMDQGDLAEQLSLVQQLVLEMKQGFSTAMDELSKIQYGDQTLQQQLADTRRDCTNDVSQVRRVVDELKNEVQQLSGQMKTIAEVQRCLQDKVEAYQTDKDILLDELEKNGAITDDIRLRLSSGRTTENNNNNVSPMIHPYLNSLQHHHGEKGPEDLNSDSSLTAALTRSLSLTQALGEKCLNLDFSTTSSDDDENSRHSHASSGRRRSHHRHFSHQYEGSKLSQMVPPHEKVSAEVHREEAARDMVEAEREYCTQIWSLIENFMTPLQDAEIVSIREFHFLFPSCLPHIYEQHCVNLRKLEERLSKWVFTGVIGDVFAKLTDSQEGDGLALYKEYIGDFPNIINGMNKWFAQSSQFREIMQSQYLASAPVLPLLLAPLQQVPKYSLLLKNLLKYTPTDHPDRYYLESSLHRLKYFLNTMNDDLEHAMQVLNINREPIKRSRDMGSSQRRSSESSGDMNQRPSTRDSGIHSTEEDVSKSPLTPSSTRRYVLQVLREKRERRNDHSHDNSTDATPSTPRQRKNTAFGSHPDLSSHLPSTSEGRHSPRLASLPQSKMFSSLSKLPMPADKGRRTHTANTHEGSRPSINRNYLRPLTPQVFPTSTSAHSFQEARRREELVDRYRPASAIEFSSDRPDFHSSFLSSYNRSSSPGHSIHSDRSRKDLHLSLQKLLLETGHDSPDGSHHDQGQYADNEPSYHKQFMSAQNRILRNGSDRDKHRYSEHSHDRDQKRSTEHTYQTHSHSNSHGNHGHGLVDSHGQEDYGIYGDDDEENEEDEHEVKPMELLPKSHRPKIMIPQWRKHTASPHPPSYRSSIDGIHKPSEYMSQENLASSLAQSLFDGNSHQDSSTTENQKEHESPVENEHNVSKSSSLKRSPRKSDSPKWSDLPRKIEKSDEHHKTSIIDSRQNHNNSPKRPTDLNLDVTSSTTNTPTTNTPSQIKNKVRKKSFEMKANSAMKLSDVIHYTADCIEKTDSKARDTSGSDSDVNPDSHTSRASSGLRLSSDSHTDDSFTHLHNNTHLSNGFLTATTADFTDDTIASVNSVLTNSTNVENMSSTPTSDILSSSPSVATSSSFNSKPNFEFTTTVASHSPTLPVNTDNLVYYFQKRGQQNSGSQHQTSEASAMSEAQSTASVTSITNTTLISGQTDMQTKEITSESPTANVAKTNTIGRLVRSDEKNGIKNTPTAEGSTPDERKTDTLEKTETSDKESVMRAVDRLRLSFEMSKQTRQANSQKAKRSEPRPIQTRLPVSMNNQPPRPASETPITRKPHVLTTFALPQKEIQTDTQHATVEQSATDNSVTETEQADQGHRMYKKVTGTRSPARYSGEPAGTARQIQKYERSTSPTARSGSPVAHTDQHERSTSPLNLTQASPFPIKPVRIGVSPPRKDVSFIPKRSRSPTKTERPKSATGFTASSVDMTVVSEPSGTMPLKSSMKETKIPVMKKSPTSGTTHLSKSSEDISKMKKKSAFKDSLKHIFGRKKKKSKLFNNGSDYVDNYDSHVTMEIGSPFMEVDEILSFPLPRERSNSASQILQTYIFEEDGEVSAV